MKIGRLHIPGLGLFAMIAVLIGAFLLLRIEQFRSIPKTSESPETTGKHDGTCMSCHDQDKGFSAYHDPRNIGCEACHLGAPEAREKELAHQDMVLIPGNLENAATTCGKCHPQELEKIEKSLMTTNSGLVAVDKFVFGESESPDHHFDIRTLGNGPADTHLRNLCANCHLGASKDTFGAIDQLSRGGGCNACHLNYSEKAGQELQAYMESAKKVLPSHHPSTDIQVKDEHCFGCHSRSGRISTNYMGWQETLKEEDEVLGDSDYKVFQDKRVYSAQPQDVHHQSGMLCVDCHSSHEVMGDGGNYAHKEDAVKLRCGDCHYKGDPLTTAYDSLDRESLLVFMHREYDHKDKEMLRVRQGGHPLVNTFLDSGKVFLIGKGDGMKREIRKQGEQCAKDLVHSELSCSSCHSQWVPRCIGCHNSFDRDDPMGYDLLAKQKSPGAWVEHVYEFSSGYPSLGVREDEEGRHIEPAVPGMIMSIEHGSFPERTNKPATFHRLYAPASPHTTGSARNCRSCHNDPLTLGYGKGELRYVMNENGRRWEFDPAYQSNHIDGLPEDAWIPFLQKPGKYTGSTRTDFRPFDLGEQRRILTLGACLECHADHSRVMQTSLTEGLDFVIKNMAAECSLPVYDEFNR